MRPYHPLQAHKVHHARLPFPFFLKKWQKLGYSFTPSLSLSLSSSVQSEGVMGELWTLMCAKPMTKESFMHSVCRQICFFCAQTGSLSLDRDRRREGGGKIGRKGRCKQTFRLACKKHLRLRIWDIDMCIYCWFYIFPIA